jgi:hypothetical protein
MNESIGRIRGNGIAGRASKKKMTFGSFPLVLKYSSSRDVIRTLVFRHSSETTFFACYISYNGPHINSSELSFSKGCTKKQDENVC